MNINNPGILDGAVTTAKLAAGAVTTAKCNTIDFAPTITGAISVDGNIEIETDVYPSLILANASAVEHWRLQENSGGGAQDKLEISNRITGNVPLACLTDDTVSLYSPLPVSSGGTGAASLAAANIDAMVSNVKELAKTAVIAQTTLYTTPAAGWYRFDGLLHVNNISGTANTVTVKLVATLNGSQDSFDIVNDAGQTSSQFLPFGTAFYADAGTVIAYSVPTVTLGSGDSFDLYGVVTRLS